MTVESSADPRSGAPATSVATTTRAILDQVLERAGDAFTVLRTTPPAERGSWLVAAAEALESHCEELALLADWETALGLPRLRGEVNRTASQARFYAEVAAEGSYLAATIDTATANAPWLGRTNDPLGIVAVFGASNFPFAFSVFGNDTASAIAAGCSVVVKAHPAHVAVSQRVFDIVHEALSEAGAPEGTIGLVYGFDAGIALVEHERVSAVAFTGSEQAGMALWHAASARTVAIPVFAEMGTVNSVTVTPRAGQSIASIADGFVSSFTMGSGQFCTKPGLVFLPEDQRAEFEKEIQEGVGNMEPFGMLTHGIATKYTQSVRQRIAEGKARVVAEKRGNGNPTAALGEPTVFGISLNEFLAHPDLSEEVFGPTTLLVHYGNEGDLLRAAHRLEGHLTATIHGTDEDLIRSEELIRVLETKVGRIVFNGFPTGVEVNHAMVHGGPFPATSDSRSTSVGSMAIWRFVRPVCYQDFPDAALPVELQNANSLGIMRQVNGKRTRE